MWSKRLIPKRLTNIQHSNGRPVFISGVPLTMSLPLPLLEPWGAMLMVMVVLMMVVVMVLVVKVVRVMVMLLMG